MATLVVLAIAGSAYTGAANAKKPPPPVTSPPPPASVALSEDLSGRLPVLSRYTTTGDFLGKGHDQVAVVENGSLNIYDGAQYGGKLLRSTPTDLKAPTATDQMNMNFWQDDNYRAVDNAYNLMAVKIASDGWNIYLAGATWNAGYTGYQLLLYQLPHDGSCATAGCAQDVERLPSLWSCNCSFGPADRNVMATSLAVGLINGTRVIAVGLSDFGIQLFIYAPEFGIALQPNDSAIVDMADGQGNQTPVVSLAFGPSSGVNGLLVGGVVSPWLSMYSWELKNDLGFIDEVGMSRAGGAVFTGGAVVLAVAATRVNGQLYSVFGIPGGGYVLDPASGNGGWSFSSGGQIVTGVTPVTQWDGDPGTQLLVLGTQSGAGNVVLKFVDGVWQPIPIGVGGATTATANQMQLWFPGYGAGRLQVANETPSAMSVSLASRQDPDYGCWLNASVTGGPGGPVPAFPTDPTSAAAQIAPQQTSPAFFIGALTAGSDGSCASAQPGSAGEWSAYVVITPVGDPADQRVVKLLVQRPGMVSIPQQVGGDLSVSLAKTGGGGSWGGWTLQVTGPGAPAAQSPPTVSAQRLTSAPTVTCPLATPAADDPCRPVYRFDVSGAQWSGVGVAGQVMARVPAMTAQGFDGQQWRDLGQLMPVTAPTLSGNTVTLGPASFFWQDAAGAMPLTAVRVVSGGLPSNVVDLTGLAAPPVGAPLNSAQGIKVTPTDSSGTARPRANGVDQAGLNVSLVPSSGQGQVPPSDKRYALVYYRDADTLNLITGLYSAGDYSGYVAVGPWPGPYANDLSAPRGKRGAGRRLGAVDPTRSYVVTTSNAGQNLEAVLNDTGTQNPWNSGSVPVAASTAPLTPTGTAVGGIQLSGCPSGPTATCALADPTSGPALYQAGGPATGPMTGLEFTVAAVTGVASLPLQQGGATHTLGSATLNVSQSQAKLSAGASSFWPSDTIDTALVTSGDLVPALSMTVGGAGTPK
jgi:hypothetical protein